MKQILVGWLLLILLAGCKEKYQLPFATPDTGYLVVEGIVNQGPGDSYIELSRTNKLSTTGKKVEAGATVMVEGQDNSSFALFETNTGRYTATLNLNSTQNYRLRIKTLDGKEYLSDFAVVKAVPAIDSISWQKESDGVQLYVNAHDAQNQTRYYLWDYRETWEYHSPFRSVLKFVTSVGPNGRTVADIAYIDPIGHNSDTTIYKCWNSFNSTQLLIGSSAKLSQDVIYKPLLKIPFADKKLSVLYSVNLRQFAITKEGYEFLEKLKKNTEENGSVFDPQPSQLKGNIHCVTNPDEPVIGYLNISTVAEKRIFIDNTEVIPWNYQTECVEDMVKNNIDSITDSWRSGLVPTTPLTLAGPSILTFGATTLSCIDCTLSGTNVKPSFWP
ncbi:DUF4249 domain-containing protein [soil metagenome]